MTHRRHPKTEYCLKISDIFHLNSNLKKKYPVMKMIRVTGTSIQMVSMI
jgi:hypothetical protein